VGFGSGENLLNLISKSSNKSHFIGFEPYLNGLASFITNLDKKHYQKTRVNKSDVRELLTFFPKEILHEIFILFPDPWPKARHAKRRIVNEANIELFLSCLKTGGKIYIATDVLDYFSSIEHLFNIISETEILNSNSFDIRPINIISTRYERKALENKRKPFYIEVKKILDKKKKVF